MNHRSKKCHLSLVLCILAFANSAYAEKVAVISPSGFALENTEGNSVTGKQGAPPFVRYQSVRSAEDFATLPPGPQTMVGINLRLDAATPGQTVETSDFEIQLSTTDTAPGDLSIYFDENHGEDLAKVRSGPLTLSSQATGPSDGPNEFDYAVIEFDTPFQYDRSLGNLLVDWSIQGLSARPFFDAHGDDFATTREILGFSSTGSAEVEQPRAVVIEFRFDTTPLLLGDFDHNGVLDAADVDALVEVTLQGAHDSGYDLNQDGVVDFADQNVWVVDLKNTWFGDANLDGEFNSGDFVQVFNAGQFEDVVEGNSTWATGDWNGDREFSSGDFVVAFQGGGYESGPRGAVHDVPEPSMMWLTSLALLAIVSHRRIRVC